MNTRVAALLDQGQSIWQDDIARSMLSSGSLAAMIEDVGIRGVTSNPTIFEKAISSSNDYDEQILHGIQQGASANEIFENLAVDDIQGACDLFRPLYDASQGGDGFISLEVSPELARDADGTREHCRELWDRVDRPNLMVKIPGTIEGTPVIEEMLAEGKNINVTLLFSLDAYIRVAEAFINALERRHARKDSVDRIASVASFFVSRVDTAVDAELDVKISESGNDAEQVHLRSLKGQAAVANAKLAYNDFKRLFGGDRFAPLKSAGAHVQRPLWASTGTKNPEYSDVLYVESLIGPHTVNTMPGKTIHAFLDHGEVRRTIDEDVEQAAELMTQLAQAGIDFDAITDRLENDGIAAFSTSFEELLGGVSAKRESLASAAD